MSGTMLSGWVRRKEELIDLRGAGRTGELQNGNRRSACSRVATDAELRRPKYVVRTLYLRQERL